MKRWYLTGLILCWLVLGSAVAALGQDEFEKGYFTLKDASGRIICRTAQVVVPGDRYLDSQNRLYEVTRINHMMALVKRVKQPAAKSGSLFTQVRTAMIDLWKAQAANNVKGPIAIYHTHTDEAYQPSEGVSSKKVSGGVVKVGDALATAFEKSGIPVVHSRTSHVPHDSTAYDRSRRTAAQMLKQRPSVLLDVHRDAVPPQEYATKVNNQPACKIQFVVGRQNPNYAVTNDFAKRVKQAVDKKYPGLIKGIFYGKGKYNQDMGSRAMLLECGSNTNRREDAMRGARAFAAATTDVLYGGAANRSVDRGGWRNLFIVLAAVAIGIGFFFLINRRGLDSLLSEFTGDKDKDKG